jgi:hypothetical protein
VRLVECGAEDFRYGLAINRIRGYYKQRAGDQANLFLLSGHDDGRGVFANASVPPEGRTQYFTFGSVVAVINSVIGGSAVAIALGAFVDASLGVAAGTGGVVAILSVTALLRFAERLLDARTGGDEALFPRRHPAARRAPGASGRTASAAPRAAPAPTPTRPARAAIGVVVADFAHAGSASWSSTSGSGARLSCGREPMTSRRAGVWSSRACRATLPFEGPIYARSAVTLASTFFFFGDVAFQSRTIRS